MTQARIEKTTFALQVFVIGMRIAQGAVGLGEMIGLA
ncbi:hypothetical protein SAMN05216604_1501, partial [Pseudomonas agarici]